MKQAALFLCAVLLTGYLGIYGEHLAIWDETGMQVLPYRAECYCPEDQQLLRQGIPFENDVQRSRLLEDYLS